MKPTRRRIAPLSLREAFERPGPALIDDPMLWEIQTTWELAVRAAGAALEIGGDIIKSGTDSSLARQHAIRRMEARA